MLLPHPMDHASRWLEPASSHGREHSTVRRLLAVQDLTIITGGAGVAALVWPHVGEPVAGTEYLAHPAIVVAVLIVVWMTMLALNGEYTYRRWGFGVAEDSRILMATLETFALVVIAGHLLPEEPPHAWLVIFFVTAGLALMVGRGVARRLLHRRWAAGHGPQRVLLVGASEPVAHLATALNRERWLGLTPVGTLHPDQYERDGADTGAAIDTGAIMAAVARSGADIVLFCEGAFHDGTDFNVLARSLEREEVHLVVVPCLCDISANRLHMAAIAGMPLVFVEKPHARRALSPSKRAWDLVFAGTALVALSPLIALLALLIKREDGGPVLFGQERIGRDGRPFTMLKLRSMVMGADRVLASGDLGPDDGNGVLFKLHDDPRVTHTGRFIRRYSLDELPQLWNVVRGEMSIVGPRPALPCEVEQYLPTVRRRLDVRPGITGLWQVSGRSDLSWEDTVRLDLYYVDNWSLWQDAAILFRTVRAVLRPAGAY